MTDKYKAQLEIEALNKQIIQKIMSENSPEEFIGFYISHTQKETIEYYGLRTLKQLRKVLEIFNYDFSKPKPSRYKGKKAARSHESYVAGGKKSAETQKENWKNKPEEEKEAWSQKMTKAHATEEFRTKIKIINKKYQENLTSEQREKIRLSRQKANLTTWENNRETILKKSYNTKKQNNSFNTSSPEDYYYTLLVEKYGANNILRQYSEERYPFACDFYVAPEDLFIELNLSWTHGGKLFEGSKEDLEKLAVWEEKSKTSDFYKNAIKTWTIRDVTKYNTAKQNNLNYKIIYKAEDLYLKEN